MFDCDEICRCAATKKKSLIECKLNFSKDSILDQMRCQLNLPSVYVQYTHMDT